MPVHQFKVDMACDGCGKAVEKVLAKVSSDIEKVEIDVDKKLVSVTTKLEADKLLDIIKKCGKECSYLGEKK